MSPTSWDSKVPLMSHDFRLVMIYEEGKKSTWVYRSVCEKHVLHLGHPIEPKCNPEARICKECDRLGE